MRSPYNYLRSVSPGIRCASLMIAVYSTCSGACHGVDYALIIGAGEYTNLQPLRYSGNDAEALRDQIITSGFEKENVYCLIDGAEQNRSRPFREMIMQHVELIAGNAQEDDLIFVWFSGHGVHMAGKSYLCGVDSSLDKPESMIEVDWVFERLRQSPAARKILIVDACRNEVEPPGRRSTVTTSSNEILRALGKPPQGLLVITSTDEGQYAIEDDRLEHGIFAHFVLEALSGKGDETEDGELTWRELFEYAARNTRDYAARMHLTAQRPRISRAEELSLDDFVLAKIKEPTVPDAETWSHMLSEGLQLLERGENEAAIRTLNVAIENEPNNPDALRIRALCYFRSREFRSAISDYNATTTPEAGPTITRTL